MSHERDGINFNLLTLRSFDDADFARAVLDLLVNGLSFVKPTKFGVCAPFDGKISNGSIQPLMDTWFRSIESASPFSIAGEKMICLEGDRGGISIMVTWNEGRFPLNSVSGSFPSKCLEGGTSLDTFLSWIEKLTSLVDPVYGFIQNMMTKGWATPYDLSIRLPEIPWGTIFGRPYIEMFGWEEIEAAPYASVEKWNSEHYFCKLTDDILNPLLPGELRKAVREHLGENAFMQGTQQPRHYKDGRSPIAFSQ